MKLHPHDQAMLLAIGVLFAAALGYGAINAGIGLPLAIGLLLGALSLGVAAVGQGGTLSAIGLPVLGMATVGLVIHAARGHAEAHFAVFSFLACTVVYRRVTAVVAGAAAIAVHHLSFNYFQAWGWGPICFTETSLLKVVEHAAYVVAEATLLAFIARKAAHQATAAEEVVKIADGLVDEDGRVNFEVIHAAYQGRSATRLVLALKQIEDVVDNLRDSSQTIHGAAQEVAKGSTQLAQRTDEAASSLQQTASALEEFTGGARLTSQSATSAESVAREASSMARDGGEAVSRAVSTMAEIQQASHRIADIIGTIDGIAFQTNILALNAAVEAARAGEQGRGFAVVASEVRSLAQRSAQAAREIKTLIQSSVETIETGTAQVSAAGERMGHMVGSVEKVSQLIGEISTAASEQSQGIGEVNGAIADLDRVTQQNAALVEESAAAADVLHRQAGRLETLIARFRTAHA